MPHFVCVEFHSAPLQTACVHFKREYLRFAGYLACASIYEAPQLLQLLIKPKAHMHCTQRITITTRCSFSDARCCACGIGGRFRFNHFRLFPRGLPMHYRLVSFRSFSPRPRYPHMRVVCFMGCVHTVCVSVCVCGCRYSCAVFRLTKAINPQRTLQFGLRVKNPRRDAAIAAAAYTKVCEGRAGE